MTVDFTENPGEEIFDKLICEACGEGFSCGAHIGKCWCFAVDLQSKTLTKLRENFQRCLCRGCLEKFEATASAVMPAA